VCDVIYGFTNEVDENNRKDARMNSLL